jgi:hypothetical protein
MKLFPLIKEIISEVGEGSAKPYAFSTTFEEGDSKFSHRTVDFKTEDNDQYQVELHAYWGDNWVTDTYGYHITIDFFLTGASEFRDADTVVNKGRLFRVMATIVKITKEFMKDIDYKEKGIDMLRISPTKTRSDEDDRRANLYTAYIKRQLPIASIEYDGDEIVAKIK